MTGDVFTGRNFRENFLFHWPNPWFWLKAEEHGNVSFGGVADAIVEKSTHDDIRIQLHVGPVVKCELINSVEQFLLLLEEHVFVEGGETVVVVVEGLVQHHVLYPTVLNHLFLTACQSMFIDFENVFSIVCLKIEAYRNYISSFKFVQGPFDKRLREGKAVHHFLRGFGSFRAQHLNDFGAKRLLRVSQVTLFPRNGFGSIKCCRRLVSQATGVKFKQILYFLSSSDGKAAQRAVNLSHVRREPFSVQLILTGTIQFGDRTSLAQFLDPPRIVS